MSRARHKAGGKVNEHLDPGKDVYAGKDSPTEHEAEEKKGGGRLKRKHGGRVEGKGLKHHGHRQGRKRGGGVGADMKPLSSAAHGKDATGHKTTSSATDEYD